MLHIKRQQQSAFHFENSPQQSIDAFPNLSHTTTGTRVSNSAQNLVSSTSTRIQPSISLSSSSSSVLSSTTVPIQSTSSSPSPLSSSSSSVVATVNNSGSKLSTGAIAGIAVGGASILLALLAIATLLFLRRRNTEKNRLSIENTKEKKPATIQNEKPYSETSSPTPLVKNQYIVNDDDEDVFWNAHPIGTFRVFSTYTQTLDDELYIQPGDKVQIYTEYDDGWCLGINLTRGGSRGVFPQHCINIERPL